MYKANLIINLPYKKTRIRSGKIQRTNITDTPKNSSNKMKGSKFFNSVLRSPNSIIPYEMVVTKFVNKERRE